LGIEGIIVHRLISKGLMAASGGKADILRRRKFAFGSQAAML